MSARDIDSVVAAEGGGVDYPAHLFLPDRKILVRWRGGGLDGDRVFFLAFIEYQEAREVQDVVAGGVII